MKRLATARRFIFPLKYNVKVYRSIYFLKALELLTFNTTKSEQSLGGGTITAGNPRLLSMCGSMPAVETEAMATVILVDILLHISQLPTFAGAVVLC